MAWFAVSMSGRPRTRCAATQRALRQIAQTGLGTGAMALVGGTVGIGGFVALSGASLVAIQGFASLGNIGVEAFTGFFAAMINVRSSAPGRLRWRWRPSVGAGAHRRTRRHAHQRGDRRPGGDGYQVDRIPGVHPGGGRTGVIIPLYAVGDHPGLPVPTSHHDLGLRAVHGTYDHYFQTFLRPRTCGWSFVEASSSWWS